MTVRTPASELELKGGFTLPSGGVPVHIHMFTLQNTTKEWEKPKDFVPTRWLDTDKAVTIASDDADSEGVSGSSYPKCPFMTARKSLGDKKTKKPENDGASVYDGVGFREGSLSYFPFAAGSRSCLGKSFALAVMRRFLWDVSSQFRLNPADTFWEEDCGVSTNAIIVPIQSKATTVRVKRIQSLSAVVANEEGGFQPSANSAVDDDGWAEDE